MLLTKLIDKNTLLNKALSKKEFITGLSNDSRKIKKGMLFAAVKGKNYDGIFFANKVISAGAKAILCSKEELKNLQNENINILTSNNIRLSLSNLSKKFFPKQPKNVVAITGTNGKTSIAHYVNTMWKKNNFNSSTIGTLGLKYQKFSKGNSLTTPDPIFLHKQLNFLKEKKIDYVALEASSHALDQHRLDCVKINCAVYTNLSRDHLDYHKNIRNYFLSKQRLFSSLLKKNGTAIININDKYGLKIKKTCLKRKIKTITYGNTEADWYILKVEKEKHKNIIYVKNKKTIYKFYTSIFAKFQLENLLCSMIIARKYGVSIKNILKNISTIPSPPGRLKKIVNSKTKLNIFIDYAHTPDALEKCLSELKKIKSKNGKLIVLFGCGGDRDKGKRRLMALVAKKNADKIFITDDNPRYESATKIRRELIKHCLGAVNIANRKKAIFKAISYMKLNDILLIAGKGHEKQQEIKGKKFIFDDAKVAKEALKLKGQK